jgi:hypothetical protein
MLPVMRRHSPGFPPILRLFEGPQEGPDPDPVCFPGADVIVVPGTGNALPSAFECLAMRCATSIRPPSSV